MLGMPTTNNTNPNHIICDIFQLQHGQNSLCSVPQISSINVNQLSPVPKNNTVMNNPINGYTDKTDSPPGTIHQCAVCKKVCATKIILMDHSQKHHKKTCGYCGKKFARNSNLKEHIRIHTGHTPYVCDVCHRGFKQQHSLKDHIRTHTGEKPFGCKLCGKRFTVKNNLKVHERVHTGVKPYQCHVCYKRFTQKGSLNTHLKKIHKIKFKKRIKYEKKIKPINTTFKEEQIFEYKHRSNNINIKQQHTTHATQIKHQRELGIPKFNQLPIFNAKDMKVNTKKEFTSTSENQSNRNNLLYTCFQKCPSINTQINNQINNVINNSNNNDIKLNDLFSKLQSLIQQQTPINQMTLNHSNNSYANINVINNTNNINNINSINPINNIHNINNINVNDINNMYAAMLSNMGINSTKEECLSNGQYTNLK